MAMAAFFVLSFPVFCFLFGVGHAHLYPDFYAHSCPGALTKIQEVVTRTVSKDPRMGASLLRLHFHDCFVNGCDASVLLNDTLISEQLAPPNKGSLRGFGVIDTIKSELESLCDGVVSCADILAVAARDSVVALGGPTWTVQLGRKDSLTANFLGAILDLPAPTSSLQTLKLAFAKKGLNVIDMVALSGGHTIGLAKCKNFRTRIDSDSNIDSTYAASLKKHCSDDVSDDDNLSPLDGTANLFDNTYFKDLVRKRGLLHSDQELFNKGSTDSLVQELFNEGSTDSLVYSYSIDTKAFFAHFASAMVKMGNLGSPGIGEIRKNCWKTN